MKLAFVNDGIYEYASGDPAAVGGAERQQWLLACALARAGWSVTVGTRERLEEGQRQAIHGVEYVGIGRGMYLPTLCRFLMSERPDWLYLRCAQHLLGPIVQMARWGGIGTIFSAGFDTDVRPRQALTRRRRLWPLYAWGLAQAERLFLQHAEQLSALPLKWRSKAHIVPSLAGEPVPAKPHLDRDKYVAWVGMLRRHKRPDLLVEIARQAPAVKFVLCGGPSTFGTAPGYGEEVMDALRMLPNVEFLGKVPPATAQRVIEDAAALLSTSSGEGFPNTFLQAWSSGTPVVSLQIDPDHIIRRFGLGAISNGVQGAVEDIERLVGSAERREEIAVRSRQYVAAHHSAPAVVKAFHAAVAATSS